MKVKIREKERGSCALEASSGNGGGEMGAWVGKIENLVLDLVTLRHLQDAKGAARCMGRERRGEAPAEDRNVGISSLKVVFTAMGAGDIIKRGSSETAEQTQSSAPSTRGQTEEENGATWPQWQTW